MALTANAQASFLHNEFENFYYEFDLLSVGDYEQTSMKFDSKYENVYWRGMYLENVAWKMSDISSRGHGLSDGIQSVQPIAIWRCRKPLEQWQHSLQMRKKRLNFLQQLRCREAVTENGAFPGSGSNEVVVSRMISKKYMRYGAGIYT